MTSPQPVTRRRVAVIPPPAPSNPAQDRLYRALGEHGVEVHDGELKPTWPRRARGSIDLVHMHWLEYLMFTRGGRLEVPKAYAAAGSVLTTLAMLRRNGMPLVWTVHNPAPHDSPAPALHMALNRHAAALMDCLITYSDFSGKWARENLRGDADVVVAPHPHYIGEYPPARRSREEVRAGLGVADDEHLFLSFGAIQPYKKIADLAERFRSYPDPRARLLVAGGSGDAAEAARIEASAAADPRIIADIRRIPDEELAELFAAADASVINYPIFSSGVLLLALSFGLPVVAPHEGAASDIAPPPGLETFRDGRVEDGLQAVTTGADRAARRAAALAVAEGYTPELQAERHLEAYAIAERRAASRR